MKSILLSIGLVVLLGITSFAQEAPAKKVWDFYWLEVLGGAVGSAVGNVLGQLAASAGACDGDGVTCGVLLGPPIGAVAGVWTVGMLNGVNGNLWLAPIGGLLGAATGIWGDLIWQISIQSDSPLWFTYMFSALGAALGFSLGASMKTE